MMYNNKKQSENIMIGYLEGIVKLKNEEGIILLTSSGVGYRTLLAASDLGEISQDEEVSLWVHTSVREDAITLFGFLRQESYELFQLLISVKGVGPKSALGILGACAPENFVGAVLRQDLHFLTSLPGIGKKGAERLLLELKDKVVTLGFGKDASGSTSQTISKNVNTLNRVELQEAQDALISLGYSKNEVQKVLEELENTAGMPGEEILRLALKKFARR